MKTLNLFIILSIVTIPIGTILMIGGNQYSDYIITTGAILGIYTMHLLDKEAAKKP
jgi:hypothetical protein